MKPMVCMIFFPERLGRYAAALAAFAICLNHPSPASVPAFGLYSAPTQPGVSDAVEMLVEEGIVDLARPRFVTTGIVRKLDMRDAAEVLLDGTGEIPLHDLHVVDIVLEVEVVRPDPVDDFQRLL